MATYIVHRQKKGFISWTIRKLTKSWSSHTALLIDCLIYESDKGFVRCLPFERWCSNSLISVDEINVDTIRLELKAQKELGKKYDFKSTVIDWVIYIVFGKWTGYTGVNSTDKFYCSEYVAYCLNKEKFYITSPEMLYGEYKNNRIFVGIDKHFKIK